MAEVLENAARLSQVIGARPGGTEEEQQASFFIEETMQKAGLSTSVEEFNCNPNYELPRFICCVISVLLGLLAMFLPLMVVPALIVTLITGVFYFLEVSGKSPLGNTMKRGISQNVVAKYIPGPSAEEAMGIISGGEDSSVDGGSKRSRASRKRKIILVARYDSGRVCRELQSPIFEALPIIHWVEIGGMALIPMALLLRVFLDANPTAAVVLNVLLAIGIIASIIPIIIYILHQTAPYSDGANNNASSVAVMTEIAKQIAASRDAVVQPVEGQSNQSDDGAVAAGDKASSTPDKAAVVMHGEDALREANVLPKGVELVYENGAVPAEGGLGLDGADMVVAAAGTIAGAVGATNATGATSAVAAGASAATAAAAGAADQMQMASGAASGATTSLNPSATGLIGSFPESSQQAGALTKQKSDVPDWFKRGKAKAAERRESNPYIGGAPIARSRFSDALEAATQVSAHSIQDFEAREAARNNPAMNPQAAAATADPSNTMTMAPVRHMGVNAVFGDDPASEATRSQASAQSAQQGGSASEPSAAAIETNQTIAEAIAAAEQEAAAQQVAEEAAVADRTISYIPVAADISADAAEIERTDVSVADGAEKSASDILEEATAKTIEAESAKKGGRARIAARKRRELSLPSLTGALGKVVSAQQDAPLAEDAARKDGEGRTALKRAERAKKSQLADRLPSTDKEPAKSTIAVASAKEGATSSFIAQVSEKDAEAALNSLDFSKAEGAAEIKERAASVKPEDKSSLDDAKAKANKTIDAIPVPVASATSQFAAIGDALIEDMTEEDIVIEDVDDSDYASNLTHTGAMAGPGYVEMPKSRASRIKGIFTRKKKDDNRSFAEAVGLDDDFDARKVGSERGGWESFQNQSADYDAARSKEGSRPHSHRAEGDSYSSNSRRLRNREDGADVWSSSDEWDDWNGGAFSMPRKKQAEKAGAERSTRRTPRVAAEGESASRFGGRSSSRQGRSSNRSDSSTADRASKRPSTRKGSSMKAAGPFDTIAGKLSSLKGEDDAPAEKPVSSEDMLSEREMIRRFNDVANAGLGGLPLSGDQSTDGEGNGDAQAGAFPTEVWFVALGAELTDNAGIKSFLSAHDTELSGAVVIELEGLGAGTLSQVDAEGTIRRKKGSSRMKRYVAKAGAALGLHINSVKMNWRESSSFFAAEKSLQTVHLVGYKDGKPEYLGEESDIIENLSEEKMMENAAFVMELMRAI